MEQITPVVVRGEAVRVGVDLAKRVIQVHAVDAAGRVLVRDARHVSLKPGVPTPTTSATLAS